ncbi:MAG TPA: hypothetical protein VJI33_03670 [Candidatus Paceibacterota bacterium]
MTIKNLKLIGSGLGSLFFLMAAWLFATSFTIPALQSWGRGLAETHPAFLAGVAIGLTISLADAKTARKLRFGAIIVGFTGLAGCLVAVGLIANGPTENEALLSGLRLPTFLGLTARAWLLVSGVVFLDAVGGLCLADFTGDIFRPRRHTVPSPIPRDPSVN